MNRDYVDELLEELGIEYPPCGFYVGEGWMPIVENALRKMLDVGWDKRLAQVKEKFKGLRIYVDGETNDKIRDIIREAEEKCLKTCEDCGGPRAPLTGVGAPVCDACDARWKASQKRQKRGRR